jgi:hypothetical protein
MAIRVRHDTNKLYFTARQKYKKCSSRLWLWRNMWGKLLVEVGQPATGYRILHAKRENNFSRNDDIQTHLPVHFFLGRNRVNVPVRHGTLASGIGSLESIPRLQKSFKNLGSEFGLEKTMTKNTKTIFLSKRRKKNIFVPQLSKEE